MLRPATPLAVLLAIAFGLLLMSVLSTPIIKAIPLGDPIEIGYDEGLASALADKNANFDLPSQARRTLSTILIIHPVAALVTLIMFIMAVAAHFHSPSHSARYLLLVFIVGLVNFVICLLAFLVDVLLFVPHMAWGSYLVLAATILVALSGLVSCAMRRTLVSRKARKKRIEQNAEMSGENFYNRQAQQQQVVPPAENKPTVPVLSGANGQVEDKLPSFATYEKRDDVSSEDRMPLTARSPSNRSQNAQYNDRNAQFNQARGPQPPQPLDQYGNPMDPSPDVYGVRRAPSAERMNSRGRGGGAYRGRGGYGPPGRGGYGYGPPPSANRGGYGPPGRGGYGAPPPNARGGYGPPSRGDYGPPMRGRPPPPGYSYERRGSPAGGYGGPQPGPYGQRQQSPGPMAAPAYAMNASTPTVSSGAYSHQKSDSEDLPRAESPPPLPGTEPMMPVGQAVAMDATTGSPQVPQNGFSPQVPQKGFANGPQFRDSDADIAGMVGLQQGVGPMAQRHQTYVSEASRYSQDESVIGQYLPPRQNWNGQRSKTPGAESVIHPSMMPPPLNSSRTDLANARGSPAPPAPTAARSRASDYYEDVAPRFATPDLPRGPPVSGPQGGRMPPQISVPNGGAPDYDDMPEGARSPAASERSTFTSISQRGINPRWNPPPPTLTPGYGPMPPRRPDRSDMLLASNPDFELPTRGRGNSPPRPGGPGMIPGSAYPNGRL